MQRVMLTGRRQWRYAAMPMPLPYGKTDLTFHFRTSPFATITNALKLKCTLNCLGYSMPIAYTLDLGQVSPRLKYRAHVWRRTP